MVLIVVIKQVLEGFTSLSTSLFYILDFSSLEYNNVLYVGYISTHGSNISISKVVCQDTVLIFLKYLTFLSYG